MYWKRLLVKTEISSRLQGFDYHHYTSQSKRPWSVLSTQCRLTTLHITLNYLQTCTAFVTLLSFTKKLQFCIYFRNTQSCEPGFKSTTLCFRDGRSNHQATAVNRVPIPRVQCGVCYLTLIQHRNACYEFDNSATATSQHNKHTYFNTISAYKNCSFKLTVTVVLIIFIASKYQYSCQTTPSAS